MSGLEGLLDGSLAGGIRHFQIRSLLSCIFCGYLYVLIDIGNPPLLQAGSGGVLPPNADASEDRSVDHCFLNALGYHSRRIDLAGKAGQIAEHDL
jgi:hypothetical protein